jgi:hypothetical protein
MERQAFILECLALFIFQPTKVGDGRFSTCYSTINNRDKQDIFEVTTPKRRVPDTKTSKVDRRKNG